MAFFQRMVQPHFDVEFFERVPGVVEGVFASADWRAHEEGRVLLSQLNYARGTERYFALQKAIMELALGLGASDATMKVGSFPLPLARHKRFLVGICVTDSLRRLNGSKARRMLASMNAALEPYQGDLFDAHKRRKIHYYFGMIIVAKGTESHQAPAGIYFGVPSSTLRSWHFYRALDEVVTLYRDANKPARLTGKPKLRKTPRSGAHKPRDTKTDKK